MIIDKSICRVLSVKDVVTELAQWLLHFIRTVLGDEFHNVVDLIPLALQKILTDALNHLLCVLVKIVNRILEILMPKKFE